MRITHQEDPENSSRLVCRANILTRPTRLPSLWTRRILSARTDVIYAKELLAIRSDGVYVGRSHCRDWATDVADAFIRRYVVGTDL